MHYATVGPRGVYTDSTEIAWVNSGTSQMLVVSHLEIQLLVELYTMGKYVNWVVSYRLNNVWEIAIFIES